jgi:hypothetical protein
MARTANRITEWLCSSAIVLICVDGVPGAVPDAEARPRRQICEQWRNYFYSVETGAFLGWDGEPYWSCYYDDDPVSRPESRAPNDYGGGWGTPRDANADSCKRCIATHEACLDRVSKGGDLCLAHFQKQAHRWCVTKKHKNHGLPLEGDYECPVSRGKPTRDCFGPAIDDCVESYAQDQPSVSYENSMKINIGIDWWGVGAGHASKVTWGGTRGYRMACVLAESEAGVVCLENLTTCTQGAGGCK